jgi:hypothetical protein
MTDKPWMIFFTPSQHLVSELDACSLEAKGLLIDCISILMQPGGICTLNSWTDEEILQATGHENSKKAMKALRELIEKGGFRDRLKQLQAMEPSHKFHGSGRCY